MQVQPNILKNLEGVPPPRILITMAKNRTPNLRIRNLFLEPVTSFIHSKFKAIVEIGLGNEAPFDELVLLLSLVQKLSCSKVN